MDDPISSVSCTSQGLFTRRVYGISSLKAFINAKGGFISDRPDSSANAMPLVMSHCLGRPALVSRTYLSAKRQQGGRQETTCLTSGIASALIIRPRTLISFDCHGVPARQVIGAISQQLDDPPTCCPLRELNFQVIQCPSRIAQHDLPLRHLRCVLLLL